MRRFYRKLANRLGYASLNRFLSECTGEDLQEQIALYQIEPWGEERIELIIAKVGSAICNRLVGGTTPADFITDFVAAATPPEPLTTNDIARNLIAAGYPVVVGSK
jgi:hypothetical protein